MSDDDWVTMDKVHILDERLNQHPRDINVSARAERKVFDPWRPTL